MAQTETATLGGGCFWCVEAVYQRVKGIESVKPGYAGGRTKNPTYKEICTGKTGHAEVAQIKFNKNIKRYFNTREIFSSSNNFNDLQELHNTNDIDRSLLTSEGRSFIGKWLILEPKLIKQN